MKQAFDKKTGDVIVLVEEEDWPEIVEIAKTLQTPGWSILERAQERSRAAIIEAIKECTKKKSLREMTTDRASKLDGFDQAIGMAENLVEQMNEQIKRIRGDQNETTEHNVDE